MTRPCSRATSRHAIMNSRVQWCGMVGAMPSRSRSRGCDQLAGEPPQRLDGRAGAAHAHLAGVVAGVVGERIDQAGHRLVEGEVGDHGRDHRAQPDLVIGARHRFHAFDARRREFEEQVVAGGRALLDLLDGVDERGEVLVLVAAAAADPRRGIEQEIEPPEVADALGKAAMAVGMGIDQAGNDEPAAGVDAPRRWRSSPRRARRCRR